MKVLVINCGSSSIKYRLFEMPEEKLLAEGLLERIGKEDSRLIHNTDKGKYNINKPVKNHKEGLKLIIDVLSDEKIGVVKDIAEIKAVGHRVVHGGESFSGSMVITPEVIKTIKEYFDLAPLHNPPNLAGIKASMEELPKVINVGCFDTAFHQTIPEVAYLYALPFEFYKKYRIRRYGFHGISHRYVARRFAQLIKRHKYKVNCITIHLGNGCSITAVKDGRSVDTSMGLTPLEGLVMGTRCGDIDPAIIFYLADKKMTFDEINQLLNKKSGLLGLSGISNDVRDLIKRKEKGNKMAKLALDIFAYRVKKYIGSYLAALGKCDAIIFTGGIGENAHSLRDEICSGLETLGIKLDKVKNKKTVGRKEGDISKRDSKIKIFVIPTNEEIGIARDTYQLVQGRK
ncbi:MAG: acetate kinase [Candidatus Omnitrophota bacterium]